MSGYSEFIYRKAESQDYEYGLGTGLVYAVNDRTQLDASIGVDLEGQTKVQWWLRRGILVLIEAI